MPPKPPPKPVVEAPPEDPRVDLKSLQDVTQHLAKAKHLRNYFQLERDKIHKLWDVSRKELDNLKCELSNSEYELETCEQKHIVELKVYKQKVRHLMYEHKMQVVEIRRHSQEELIEAGKEHAQRMLALRGEKQLLHTDIENSVKKHEESVDKRRYDHRYLVDNTRRRKYRDMIQKVTREYETKISVLREELELRRRAEIHEIEERKNEHINELIKKHDEAFSKMKAYYNKITTNNLELIRNLKEEIANMKRNDKQNEDLMHDIEKDNQELNGPLDKAKREVAEMQQQLANYEKDKISLRNTKSRLKALDMEYQHLQDQHGRLQDKFAEVAADRDKRLHDFEAALREVNDVSADQNVELQQKLNVMNERAEATDTHLSSVLTAVNLEPAALDQMSRRMEDALDAKNRAIKDLHFELRKIERQHREVMSEYERRCRDSQIPVLDLAALKLQ